MAIEKMVSHTYKGIDYMDSEFSMKSFTIKDKLASEDAVFPYLIETYIPLSQRLIQNLLIKKATTVGKPEEEKNAISIKFSNNIRKNKTCPLSLTVASDA